MKLRRELRDGSSRGKRRAMMCRVVPPRGIATICALAAAVLLACAAPNTAVPARSDEPTPWSPAPPPPPLSIDEGYALEQQVAAVSGTTDVLRAASDEASFRQLVDDAKEKRIELAALQVTDPRAVACRDVLDAYWSGVVDAASARDVSRVRAAAASVDDVLTRAQATCGVREAPWRSRGSQGRPKVDPKALLASFSDACEVARACAARSGSPLPERIVLLVTARPGAPVETVPTTTGDLSPAAIACLVDALRAAPVPPVDTKVTFRVVLRPRSDAGAP